jgi:ParB family transcriptional regulator, chromosome partitioning protein
MSKEPDRNPRKALGKGLSALLPNRQQSTPAPPAPEPKHEDSPALDGLGALKVLALTDIQAGKDQPREVFDDEKLDELAESIKVNGLIQPITVYQGENGKFTIIAGERRWRAATVAGLTEIPAFVRDVERHKVLELALIENLQREDLNPVEVAHGFQRLISEYGLSHEQVAERTGKDRSTVTNFLRILKLSPQVMQELIKGNISMGHARALLNITNPDQQFRVCEDIVARRLSVRETEALVKKFLEPAQPKEVKEEKPIDPNVRAALDEMSAALGTKVRLISKSDKAGKIEIEYYSPDDLDRIYSAIVRRD